MCCLWCANRVYQLTTDHLICDSTCSVRMVWTLHISLCVFVCYFQVLPFFLDSNLWYWRPDVQIAKTHDPCSIWYDFVFVIQRRLTNVWVHKQTNILPIAIFCISSLIVINVSTTEMYWLLKQRVILFHGWQNYNNKRSAGNRKQEVSLYV